MTERKENLDIDVADETRELFKAVDLSKEIVAVSGSDLGVGNVNHILLEQKTKG